MTLTLEEVKASARKGDVNSRFLLAVMHLQTHSSVDAEFIEVPEGYNLHAAHGLNHLKAAAMEGHYKASLHLGDILMSPEDHFLKIEITNVSRDKMFYAGTKLLALAHAPHEETLLKKESFLTRLFDGLSARPLSGVERTYQLVNDATDMLVIYVCEKNDTLCVANAPRKPDPQLKVA